MLLPDASSPPERLRIGQCTVDVLSREIHAPGARRPFRVTPKAMAVLLVLAASADRVVSREMLLEQVWPDTHPSDDVLTQAVTQLRKAFQEVRGDPRYIETIAKGGYRLLAPVESLEAPTLLATGAGAGTRAIAPEPASARPPPTGEAVAPTGTSPTGAPPAPSSHPSELPRSLWRPAVIVAALLVLVLVVALLGRWWMSYRDASEIPEPSPAEAAATAHANAERIEPFLITSAPGFELAPSLSPGGGQVAYMAVPEGQRNIAIMLQTTAPVAPRQLTFPQGMAEDSSPQWSPEGREIAFLRVTPGQDCRLMVIRPTGRGERTVAQCDPDNQPGFGWTPDGRGFILDRGAIAGLQVLDLASGEVRALDYDADPDRLDRSPRYSPDGRWIVFLRNLPLGDFWRVAASGGKAERLTRMSGEIRGWDWLADSSTLVYARRIDGISRLYRFDIASGDHVELGVEDGEQPAAARNAASLAYVLRHPRFGIYRFSVNGERAGERLFASSGRDRVPSIAPDGRQLVFASDRAGPFGLWWGDVDDPASLRMLEGIQPDTRQPAAWSSDGKRVLLVGTPADSRPGGTAQAGVFEVFPDSGRMSRLALRVGAPVQAAFAPGPDGPDQRLLVLADDGEGRLRLNLFDAARPSTPLATIDNVTRLQVDAPGKRVIFTRGGDPGLWQVDTELSAGSIRPVELPRGVTRWQHAWAATDRGGVFLVRRTPACPALLVQAPQAASVERDTQESSLCLDQERRASTRALTFSPRTGDLFVALAEYDRGDIGFSRLFAPQ
ncbi:winged helix-turn-helix domain-containing protein [Lysobacter ciconiae]|uniref:Winged helix-turn-helix domain-containing protein n=1 Tax=Novilysobacter ciconiae TaxID=2781022 RepID=A0A7S6UGT0_9GAMM|nr:winged helix-turn-helix domain-containing protein [Lysobacter ciconiae]QOW20016.1 winged helix-turn-helix domain-containing protein [Lysobacter ciconiae]